jgi:hypothetical protein
VKEHAHGSAGARKKYRAIVSLVSRPTPCAGKHVHVAKTLAKILQIEGSLWKVKG